MLTTSGLLTYLQQRYLPISTPLLLVLAFAFMAAAAFVVLVAAELLAVAPEPIISAPVRWGARAR